MINDIRSRQRRRGCGSTVTFFAHAGMLGAVLFSAATWADFSEDFESFEFGTIDGQLNWNANNNDSLIVDSGIEGFGARSLTHTITSGTPFFEILSPTFTTPNGESIFFDLVIESDNNAIAIKPWDLGGGIQNTILEFRRDGSMTALQLNQAGLFTSEVHGTSGTWSSQTVMRIGFTVDATSLKIWQDGEVIFEGHDMAQAYPFGGPDTGIGQLRFSKGADFVGGTSAIFVDNIGPSPSGGGLDSDGDTVVDDMDNCTLASNADQRDTDSDGYGNACDADLNNDGIINALDLGALKLVFFSADEHADFDGDGVVNAVDLGVMRRSFFGAPGPSGVAR